MRPDKTSLRLIAGAWARGASGVVRHPSLQDKGVLVKGEPTDARSLAFIVQALYRPDTSFTPADLFAGLAPVELGPELWIAARRRRNARAILERLDHAVVERSASRAVERLPLSPDTRRLLKTPMSARDTLSDVLARAGLEGEAVADELSMLVVLGLYRLRRAAGTGVQEASPAPRTRPSRSARSAPTRAGSRDNRRDQERALARLQREWKNIQDADDWTVLGVSQSMSPEIIERACERMLARFGHLERDPRLSAEAQALASQLHERVQASVVRVRQGRPRDARNKPASTDPEEAGRQLLVQGDFAAAVKCFNMARHRDPYNASAVAWLGWAVYHDPTVPVAKRRAKGKELLSLAESMDASLLHAQLLLARLDAAEGNLVIAWNRLDRLVRQHPEHVEARSLLVQVQSDIRTKQ